MGAGRDAESMGVAAPITIIEVMGRDAGWLAAASAFAKRDERDAPHYIGVPEIALDETRFLDCMEDAYRRNGFAVAVIAENVRTPEGKPWANRASHTISTTSATDIMTDPPGIWPLWYPDDSACEPATRSPALSSGP